MNVSIKKDLLANYPNYIGMKIPDIAKMYNCSEVNIRAILRKLPDDKKALFLRPYRKKKEGDNEKPKLKIEKSANERINDLEKRIVDLEEKLLISKKSNSSLEDSCKSMQEEIQRLEKVSESKSNILKQQAQRIRDAEDIEEEYRKEVENLQEQVDELVKEYELLASSEQNFLCSEFEHYDGEIKDAIITAIECFIGSLPECSNYKKLLEGFLVDNPPTKKGQDIGKAIERAKSASNAREFKSILEKVGFDFGKPNRHGHFKCRFYGDPRYQVTIAKTPSDNRAFLNTVSDIKKMVF